jgi:hypothetical protein
MQTAELNLYRTSDLVTRVCAASHLTVDFYSDEVGALDAPEFMPSGACWSGQRLVMQGHCMRPGWLPAGARPMTTLEDFRRAL